MRDTTESKITAAKNALAAGLRSLVTSDDWAAMLRVMAQRGRLSVGRLSFRNQILCMIQAPGAAQVATYPTWQREGRQVRRGEKAIWIIQPRMWRRSAEGEGGQAEEISGVGFRALPVFTLEQTEGEPLADAPALPDVTAPEAFADSVERLRAVALGLDGVVSDVTLRGREDSDRPEVDGWYAPRTRGIVVLTDKPRAHVFRVLVHEIAHAILHGGEDHHSAPVREVEAESVAFVVCHALGLDTGPTSFPYVAIWASRAGKADAEAILETGQRIARAAGRILEALGVGVESEGEQGGRAAA